MRAEMIRTLVLSVEGPLSTPSAEGVGFGVALTEKEKVLGSDWMQIKVNDHLDIPEGRGTFRLLEQEKMS